jgi:hypothetical protein
MTHSDVPEETALHERRLDPVGPFHESVPIPAPDLQIHDQPILAGQMANDPVGIRQNRIMTGQGGQNVRFDLDAAKGFIQEEASENQDDRNQPRPSEAVTTAAHGHHRFPASPSRKGLRRKRLSIRRKINRLNVPEFLQKSTKGRKWEILVMPGV